MKQEIWRNNGLEADITICARYIVSNRSRRTYVAEQGKKRYVMSTTQIKKD
ncbi:MAG: hypothetical protein ABF868_07605 [Sporolactobacillus sp.]